MKREEATVVELNADQQDFVDELIWENRLMDVARFYRAATGCGLNQAAEALDIWRRQLGVSFDGDSLARNKAFERLSTVKDTVVVIEGSWDGDSWGWYIGLSAIAQVPSLYHPRYTEYGLCSVRGFANQMERAVALGTELAEAAGTHFHLTSVTEFPPVRWWDTHSA